MTWRSNLRPRETDSAPSRNLDVFIRNVELPSQRSTSIPVYALFDIEEHRKPPNREATRRKYGSVVGYSPGDPKLSSPTDEWPHSPAWGTGRSLGRRRVTHRIQPRRVEEPKHHFARGESASGTTDGSLPRRRVEQLHRLDHDATCSGHRPKSGAIYFPAADFFVSRTGTMDITIQYGRTTSHCLTIHL